MMTRFPDLVELEGENRIVQADAYGEDVRGFTEFLGVTIVNETDMVGVQRSKTTISEISSDRDGMGIEVRLSSPCRAHFPFFRAAFICAFAALHSSAASENRSARVDADSRCFCCVY
jgi:hypothetical protein